MSVGDCWEKFGTCSRGVFLAVSSGASEGCCKGFGGKNQVLQAKQTHLAQQFIQFHNPQKNNVFYLWTMLLGCFGKVWGLLLRYVWGGLGDMFGRCGGRMWRAFT